MNVKNDHNSRLILPPGLYLGENFFTFRGSTGATGRSVYVVPRFASMLRILAQTGGHGGGNGYSGVSGTTRGGGGGGSGGAWAITDIPTRFVSSRLTILVGAGGNPGGAGAVSVVYDGHRDPQSGFAIIVSGGGSAAPAGSNGTASAGGAGGQGSNNYTADDYSINGAIRVYSVGNGGNGGPHTGGVGVSGETALFGGNNVVHSARGGAGVGTDDVGYAGGGWGASTTPWLAATLGGAAGGGRGQDGQFSFSPLCSSSGTGGGSNGTGPGGDGGDGAWGSGGGGGGAGTTGGTGGRGGDGFVIIWAY